MRKAAASKQATMREASHKRYSTGAKIASEGFSSRVWFVSPISQSRFVSCAFYDV